MLSLLCMSCISVAALRRIVFGAALVLGFAGASVGQTWMPLKNPPSVGVMNPLLLTDGTVIVQSIETPEWWRLTPDEHGSYVNGTWSQIASMPNGYVPLFYASAVLPDGRVIVEGGEYLCPNGACGGQVWSTKGAIYDSVANKWKAVAPPAGWTGIGDAQSVVLANGTFMLANCCNTQDALLNAKTLTWTLTGNGKADGNNEEGWTLLPNDLVLTVDVNNPSDPTNSEVYAPKTGTWSNAGSTVVQLDASNEIGPAVLRPNGTVFATGATGHNSIYNAAKGVWTPGPDFPEKSGVELVAADAPAALLPDGNVLVTAAPNGAPTYFFEFDGTNLKAVPGPPNAAHESTDYINMLVLPTGNILATDSSSELEVYTAAGTYNAAWRPKIVSSPQAVEPGVSYTISGTQFNGMSQGAAFGDDEQSATNYPLVRITNKKTGHVFYSRTYDHSSMAVAFAGIVSTHFEVPARQELGESELVVVANGIPSEPVTVDVR